MNNKLYLKINWNNHDTINYNTDFYIYLQTEEETITKSEIIKRGIGLDLIKDIAKSYEIKAVDLLDYNDILKFNDEKHYMSIVCRLLLALNIDSLNNHAYIPISFEDQLALVKYSNREFIFEL